jgi:hypothetical protein
MKKSALALLVLLCLAFAFSAQADYQVNWGATDGGFYFAASPRDGILGAGTGNSTIAQLIWSDDAIADDADSTLSPDFTDPSEVLLDEAIITENGVIEDPANEDAYAQFGLQAYTVDGSYSTGYLYARIFQQAYGDPLDRENMTIQNDDWYFIGPIIPVSVAMSGSSYDYELNSGLFGGDAIDTEPYYEEYEVRQVVPEPGSFALFALGAVLVRLVRRKAGGEGERGELTVNC